MSARLHDRLLAQARHLSSAEARRPRQASLRRSISATYYALFHFLVHECTVAFVGTSRSTRPLREALSRSFDHGTMRDVALRFSTGRGSVPRILQHCLPPEARGLDDLALVSSRLLRLQDQRHLADYDLSARFTRREALLAVRDAEQAMAAWRRIRKSDEAHVFRVALVSWRGLRGR